MPEPIGVKATGGFSPKGDRQLPVEMARFSWNARDLTILGER
jgi:hypothetical protein